MQEITDNSSEYSRVGKTAAAAAAASRKRHPTTALKDASQAIDKVEFAKSRSRSARHELREKLRKKRNDDFVMLMKVLAVFLLFDFLTREFFFQASLPHLKAIE